jgi:flavin-dependent dehydrogenase
MPDAIVVGAGPAGSATALLLARGGRDVRIVERARFPRRKVCGEYLNAGTVDALARLGLLERVRAVAQPLQGVRIVAAGASPVALPFVHPALACAREALDALLLDAALEAGATLEHGRVDDVIVERARCVGVRIRDEEGALVERRAAIVVGADGIGSTVARKLDLAKTPRRRARYAVGGHFTGFGELDGHVEMYVGSGDYVALNPLGEGRTNVMVVVGKERLARWAADVDAGLRDAAAALAHGVRTFAGVTRIGPRVSIGPLAHRVRRPIAPGAMLVGDAAGFLDPFTGQGVHLALTGAEQAAGAILGGDLEGYARWRTDDERRRARLCAAVKLLVETPPLARHAAARLARLPDVGAALLDALAGTVPPERAFGLGVLGRLVT